MNILIKRVDGGVSVMRLINGADAATEVDKWKTTYPNAYVSHREIDELDIPVTREFRNAWVDVTDDNNINIDLSRAKEAQLAKLRALRNKSLEKLDKEYIIALELGTAVQEIKAAKQQLRDITEGLKNLVVAGVDDEEALTNIKELGYEGGHILLTGKA